ncbi:MAG: PQQ-dependent sugar dehydrogenase [Candidatus Nitrosocosmicus sp.]|uniref:PQQ-dependent sugar dehydrogenase n=1 Tax=Candidatus Nitrosocosmicus agrestis TaxID=2563600 RepID=UPI00122E043E|nr:PQQ-dependent sugar dehydrogenase [Candidatus Nitrosocosmicus sp. SS]KAA2282981.1 hypothetical protein F1Z66_04785 [Candidatus Nitrosocosmicus sp. SS]KAF0869184.1 hypothetical protein E5N71_07065 [Candidatus Nitrosocosmicus sp. SS]MDR4489446.1 PQQ-dependent sugar dehydrogenase [Candidatus Nitrosocosmicus sp.]
MIRLQLNLKEGLLLTFPIILVFMILVSSFTSCQINSAYGAYAKAPESPTGPTVNDDNLAVEKVAGDLDIPTSMAFLGPNDILVTEKETGKVMRITDGKLMPDPVLDVPVAASIERGLLGIAISKNNQEGKTFIFLFYTASGNGVDESDVDDEVPPLGNRLYRYELVDGQLKNPVLLLDLSAIPPNDRPEHNGGKVLIGPDNNVYLIVGEVGGHRTQAQNVIDGPAPNGLGGVLRITQDGKIVDPDNPIFGEGLPLNIYYAMGIRNSFGMDFDPLTGNLWDTENGPDTGDEINLVFPGFNSGWVQVQGYMSEDLLENGVSENDLVYFGNSHYADPKFVWDTTIGITALKFLNSDKLGKAYQNNMFVGDINNGLLYRFTLNEARDNILINNTYVGDLKALQDNEINDPKENQPLIFGQGFGGITDIQVGPDGYLYVLTYTGSLYKILPKADSTLPISQKAETATEDDSVQGNSVNVVIRGINGGNSYSPNPIEIQAGQTVTWYNGDTISHTVTSGQDGDDDEGSLFDSDAIIPNQHYSATFDEPGEYDYYCVYHPSMVGEVKVE